MKSDKEKLLYQTFDAFIKACLSGTKIEDIEEWVDPKIMGFGSAIDEKVKGMDEFVTLLANQNSQTEGMEISYKSDPIKRIISEDGNTAIFADDLYLYIGSGEDQVEMYLRMSVAFAYSDNKWKAIHWHGSKPELVENEKDSWGLDAYKQKAEKLQKLVDEQTSDLISKNRELEIETSLEKVRASMMSMKSSPDLLQVIKSVFTELQSLGFSADACAVITYDEEYAAEHWYSGYGTEIYPKSYTIPYTKKFTYNYELVDAWKNKVEYESFIMEGQHKEDYANWLIENSDFGELPDEFLAHAKSTERIVLNDAFNKYGMLEILGPEELSKEDAEILTRFSKVFEQTYTRFLDLQKAEEQAREAQIEVGLERIRARSMAMHQSDELLDLSVVLFQELEKLGVSGFFNCGFIEINQKEEKQSGWVTMTDGTIGEGYFLPLKGDAVLNARFEAWKAGEASFCQKVNGEELEAHLAFTIPTLGSKRVKKMASTFPDPIYFYCFNFKEGYLSIISGEILAKEEEAIILRFTRAFGQAYTRFLDLQKAEEQAREAEIALALERVRARTMAMQTSSELEEVSLELFDQVKQLGIETWATGFNVWLNDSSYVDWVVSPNGFLKPYTLDLTTNPFFRKISKARKNREEFLAIEGKGKVLEDTYRLLSEMAGSQLENLPESGFQFPKYQINHYVFGSQVSLMFITFKKCPEYHDIFKRFGKVFEQTYTRFLDLKKAEEQAKEAQIEVSLERVRASGNAMKDSSALAEVISVLFKELQILDFEAMACGICLYQDDLSQKVWAAGFGEDIIPKGTHLPYLDHPYYEAHLNAWKNEAPFQEFVYEGELKKSYDEISFASGDFFEIPEEEKNAFIKKERLIFSDAFMKYGMLEVVSETSLSDKQSEWLIRFSMAFEKTFTRFLDLQKAEAQAREAQIEVGLERVRASAMAMRHSEDLEDCTKVVFDELEKLNLNMERSGIGIFDPETKDCQLYTTAINPEGEKELVLGITSLTIHPMLIQTFEAWEKQESLSYTLEGKDLKSYYDIVSHSEFVLSDEILEKSSALPKEYYHYSPFGAGGLYFFSDTEPHTEDKRIMQRFAEVFDLTYTRFLDLQKAEKQARDAQIETAIERVRAASMAMHTTQELGDVVTVLFDQFSSLGLHFYQVWINIFKLEESISNCWFSPVDGIIDEAYTAVVPLEPFEDISIKSWREGKEFSFLSWKGKKEVDRLMDSLSEIVDHPSFSRIQKKRKMERLEIVDSNHKYGVVAMAKDSEITDEDLAILKRFTIAFEQAYTRFLDLKKAEEQAREAQIEAALERVRAQTMAMHNSEDVGNSTLKLFSEITTLGVHEGTRFGVGILNHEDDTNQLWTASKEGEEVKMLIGSIDMTLHPLLQGALKAWKEKKPLHTYVLEKDDLKNYYKILNKVPDYKFHKDLRKLPPREFHYGFIFDYGFFYTFSPKEFDSELIRIVQRFSEQFGRTYRRYLDLRKAEKQARDAQIEAALERVRARSMAMHKSSELLDTVDVMYAQLKELGYANESTDIEMWLLDEKAEIMTSYASSSNFAGPDSEVKMEMALKDLPEIGNWFETWKKTPPNDRKQLVEHHTVSGKAFINLINTIAKLVPTLQESINGIKANGIDKWYWCNAHNRYGSLSLQSPQEPEEESIEVIRRFSSAFEQAYTRFLDLKKAEALAREAKIEATLERVRARSMAMQSSEELSEVITDFYSDIKSLDVHLDRCMLSIVAPENQEITWWMAGKEGLLSENGLRTPKNDHQFHKTFVKVWKKQKKKWSYTLDGEEKKDWDNYAFSETGWSKIPKPVQEDMMALPAINLFGSSAAFGSLLVSSVEDLSEEQQDLINRFATSFNQTFTRFLDLQKAEAQAREAKIEAALEKVRARTMGMQHSDELLPTSTFLLKELRGLGHKDIEGLFGISLIKPELNQFISFVSDSGGPVTHERLIIPLDHHPFITELFVQWKKFQKDKKAPKYLSRTLTQAQLNDWVAQLFSYNQGSHPNAQVPDGIIQIGRSLENVPHWTFEDAFYKQGILFYQSIDPLPEDFRQILIRFAKVFEQTYTRFLDLQKAEAQAREAKIEAALEKVRARTMGMQHSDELPEAANILFTEVQNLGIPAWSCGYCIFLEDKRSSTCIMSSEGTLQKPFLLPHHGEVSFDEWGEFVNSKELFYVQELGDDALESHYGFMKSLPELKLTFQELEEAGLTLPTYQINHLCKFSNGFLLFITYEKVPDAHNIFKRFTRVFEQTYTRFLDLQKAEEQAREAQIELSLERIRAQVTAMMESSELLEIVVNMRKEFVSLGHEAHYFWHMRWLPNTYAKAMTSGDGTQIGMVMTLPRHIHGDIPAVAEWEKSNEPTHILAMDVDLAVEYVDKMIKLGDFERVDPQSPTLDDIRRIGGLTFVMARTTHGEIGYSLPGNLEHPPQESIDTLIRFAGVFDLAYRRFEDLLTAEKQNRKAKIELALERVRARAMAMQQPEELIQVANVMREEMGLLGVEELETSSIFLNKNTQGDAECWYSIKDIRDGEKNFVQDHFNLNYQDTWVGRQMAAFYQGDTSQTSIVMKGENRLEWINYCAKKSSKLSGYYGDEIPERTYHLYKFSNGAIGAATPGEISAESWDLLRRAALVFSLAYSRFKDLTQAREDLANLKKAKAKAEKALKKLEAAQEQLIQQEKLASLGQLTAGIAHEIKNPLNFVNNFSELSGELIDEVFEELENIPESDAKEEIVAILEDVKSNLIKVNEHGSRADGIVKSMLQHSRAAGSKEESKDFNALVKEFVNLSFHGMRAGKAPINVDIDLDLDPDVHEVKLITEDFSRVILNICNNAFDAMREKLGKEEAGYLAKLSVSTKSKKDGLELVIKDNGPGIPKNILDKVLQPFFTTKKGTEGTGLGLSITHDIITAHGGELSIKSKEEVGTEFIIQLPIR